MEYRGCTIEVEYDFKNNKFWSWFHDDTFDIDWDGEDYLTTGCGWSDSIEGCMEEIDEYLDKLENGGE